MTVDRSIHQDVRNVGIVSQLVKRGITFNSNVASSLSKGFTVTNSLEDSGLAGDLTKWHTTSLRRPVPLVRVARSVAALVKDCEDTRVLYGVNTWEISPRHPARYVDHQLVDHVLRDLDVGSGGGTGNPDPARVSGR